MRRPGGIYGATKVSRKRSDPKDRPLRMEIAVSDPRQSVEMHGTDCQK